MCQVCVFCEPFLGKVGVVMFLAVINIVKLGKYLNSVHNKGKMLTKEARFCPTFSISLVSIVLLAWPVSITVVFQNIAIFHIFFFG